MGLEVVCTVTHADTTAEAAVLLETDFVAARGAVRFEIPFRSITKVSARDGVLEIVHAGGTPTLGNASLIPRQSRGLYFVSRSKRLRGR